jgi:hypothetical protein
MVFVGCTRDKYCNVLLTIGPCSHIARGTAREYTPPTINWLHLLGICQVQKADMLIINELCEDSITKQIHEKKKKTQLWLTKRASNVRYTGCFTTCGHYCSGWFPRSVWSKKVRIKICPILDGYGVMGIFNSGTRPRVNRVLRNQLARGLSFALQALFLPPDSPTQLQSPFSVTRHLEVI